MTQRFSGHDAEEKEAMAMLWWLLLTAVILALLIPLRLQLDVHRGQRRVIHLGVTAAGLRRSWQVESSPGPQREVEIRSSGGAVRRIAADPSHGRRAWKLLTLLRQSPLARRFLLDHVHPLQLDAQWLFHASSAAATALATGGLHMALAFLPARWLRTARVRILPDFLRDHSTLQARCIFLLRPGTILITAGLIAFDGACQALKREAQRIWNTPSEN